ncbi:MAG: DUF4012 domain-containing protein, partial [Acidimicrobiia bacterium]|nr:DUF4012 domain-containing protein [Acidimicrobiia bacterium]
MPTETPPLPTPTRRRSRRRSVPRWQLYAVAAVSVASAVGAALTDNEPTGHDLADTFWLVLLGAAVPLAASRARRWSVVVLATLTTMGSGGGRQLLAAVAPLVVAVTMAVLDRRHRVLGALVGAGSIQVLLRLPDFGFHGASALLVAAATVPLVVSGLRNTRSRWRRPLVIGGSAVGGIVLGITLMVGTAALISQGKVANGIDEARAGLDATAAGDAATAVAHFRAAAAQLDGASSMLGSRLLAPARAVPVIGQHQQALAVGTGSARDLALAAADAADAVELDGLRPTNGRVDLDAVRGIEAPLANAMGTLETALAGLSSVDSPWLASPVSSRIDDLKADMASALPDARTALAGARVAPTMLGGDGPRTWLVLFTTPAEARLLGGFVGSWATIEVSDGALTLVDSGQSRDVINGPGADDVQLDIGDEFLERYARYTPNVNFQNATVSPHFPSSAQVAASFFTQSMGTPIDGVITVDPLALGGFADLVGGVDDLPIVGGPFDGAALAELLLVSGYELASVDQEEVLDAAVQQTFSKFTAGSLPGPRGLADALSPYVHEGRLLMWSADPAEQELLVTLGLDGSLPPADGTDMVLVGIDNNGASKIDIYIDRDITHDVRYDPATGATTATVTATFTNTATLDLPEVVIGNNDDLPLGTANTYVTIFTPLALQQARVDGQIVGVASHPEQGFQTYSALVAIPPGGELTMTWELAGTLSPGGYHLRYHNQPLV